MAQQQLDMSIGKYSRVVRGKSFKSVVGDAITVTEGSLEQKWA